MNYNQNYNNEQHPEHPVRNVFFCIFCFFFSISFNYLWVWQLFDSEYTWQAVLISIMIIVGAVIGGFISFRKSHRNYSAYKRNRKNRYYR